MVYSDPDITFRDFISQVGLLHHNSEPDITFQRPTRVSADICREDNVPGPTGEQLAAK
ncbi:uncharacterized protein H6S33_005028 [Morchella sextelata]|uniref:uncharacterized protein n=1 Tax=Morchella sextelata TaxID=1174677 RepID=UPI001D03737D|nr:uncharacterized protein H6S33_005028 [Morchella sextelata]KAH0605046.1 hypothetical protein H6S33_005028 [Morchella sextelata]